MILESTQLGVIEIEEESIINFPAGLPAFEDEKRFTIVRSENDESPFQWLHSVDNPSLAFVIAEPFQIFEDYEFELNDAIAEEIGIQSMRDIAIFGIVVVPEDLTKMSINLKAPIVINARERKGAQVILDTSKYSVRHYILDQLKRQGGKENVNTCAEEGSVDCPK